MKYAVPIFFVAGPAFAHHEAVAVSVLPSMILWAAAVAAAAATAWRWYNENRK